MDSKRERILSYFQTALQPLVTGSLVTAVLRSDADAQERDDAPYLTINWSRDLATPSTVPQMERTITIEIGIYTRGNIPDELADQIAVAAHSAVMADTHLGGLAVDTSLGNVTFEALSADQTAGRLIHEYNVVYRHSFGDLTQ